MRNTTYCIAAAALVSLLSSSAAIASGSKDAKHACKQEMKYEFDADSFHGVTSSRVNSGVYQVSGYAERNDHKDEYFTCKVKHGEIRNLDFDGWSDDKEDKNSKIAAAAAIGLAIAVAVAASRPDEDDDDDDNRYSYQSDNRYKDRPNQWHPKSGVTCYRDQRACYEVGAGYSARWTNREFF